MSELVLDFTRRNLLGKHRTTRWIFRLIVGEVVGAFEDAKNLEKVVLNISIAHDGGDFADGKRFCVLVMSGIARLSHL